jgi:hypothetical protein
METYIVSFIPGTSGRFISNIMYQLILDKTDKLYWSDKGSAHDNNTFMSSWDISECSTTIDRNLLLDNIEFYKNFKFKDTGVAYSHVFPNFDLLRERLPDTKIVIISFTLDNKTEISFNNVLKNFIPDKDNEFKKMFKSKLNLDADNNIEQFKKYTTNYMKATSAKFSRKDLFEI